jgi:hypothetical protein
VWSNSSCIIGIAADPNSLSPGRVKAIYQEPHGVLWAGLFPRALDRLDRKTGKTRYTSTLYGVICTCCRRAPTRRRKCSFSSGSLFKSRTLENGFRTFQELFVSAIRRDWKAAVFCDLRPQNAASNKCSLFRKFWCKLRGRNPRLFNHHWDRCSVIPAFRKEFGRCIEHQLAEYLSAFLRFGCVKIGHPSCNPSKNIESSE